MRKLFFIFGFLIFLFSLSFVFAISCSEADYDSDGDVDFSDLFKIRACLNNSIPNDVDDVNCSFFDYDSDGVVENDDLEIFKKQYQKVCEEFDFSFLGCKDVDFTLDGIVNGFDLLRVRQCFNKSVSEFSSNNDSCSIDLNGDDFIDDFELGAVKEFYLQECVAGEVCVDSDGGIDYHKKGIVRIEGGAVEYPDYCKSHFKDNGEVDYYELEERYCEDGEVKSKIYICPDFCEEGKCVDSLSESNDSENEAVERGDIVKNIEARDIDYDYDVIGENLFKLKIIPDIELDDFDEGDSFYFKVNVENEEGWKDDCSSKVKYVDEEIVGAECDVKLKSGGYLVIVFLDFKEEIEESSEEDNFYKEEILLKNASVDIGSEGSSFGAGSGGESVSDVSNVSEEVNVNETMCGGCLFEGRCFDLGYRRAMNGSLVFCSESGWEDQGVNGNCNNNFECESNVCVSGECVEAGFIQKVMNWFRKIFS